MKHISYIALVIVQLALSLNQVQNGHSARILSISFMTTKSHKITYDLLLLELAKRGHDVTVLSPIPSKSNSTNPREILTMDVQSFMDKGPDMFEAKLKGESINPFVMIKEFAELCRSTYALPQVQEIMSQEFDLVMYEPIMNECMAGLVHKLGAPTILITTVSAPAQIVRIFGGPSPPSFVPNIFTSFENRMNFVERIRNFFAETMMTAMYNYYFNPTMEAVYREILNDPSLPGTTEVFREASLILSVSHFSLSGARPFMPDVIEVGGMHLREGKQLPKDIEDFINGSGDDGFVFFSMGSILQGSKMPESHRLTLVKAFSQLKQRVLWKWETETMADLPSNVKLLKWAPQQDILGHPKIRAFITHGGLGSTTESLYHGVPLIGIPMFGDQLTNMEKFLRLGVAVQLDFNSFSAEDIVRSVETIVAETKYATNAKKLSVIFKDQRDDPLERAVFWTEYVIRHKGAAHLRSPARDLNFFQYHSLDVISALLFSVFLTSYVLYSLIKILLRFVGLIGGPKDSKVSNGKKRN